MGIKIKPNVFQNATTKLVQDMKYVKSYRDDMLLLFTSKSSKGLKHTQIGCDFRK